MSRGSFQLKNPVSPAESKKNLAFLFFRFSDLNFTFTTTKGWGSMLVFLFPF